MNDFPPGVFQRPRLPFPLASELPLMCLHETTSCHPFPTHGLIFICAQQEQNVVSLLLLFLSIPFSPSMKIRLPFLALGICRGFRDLFPLPSVRGTPPADLFSERILGSSLLELPLSNPVSPLLLVMIVPIISSPDRPPQDSFPPPPAESFLLDIQTFFSPPRRRLFARISSDSSLFFVGRT